MVQFENKYALFALLVIIPIVMVWLYHTRWRNKVMAQIGQKAILENMVVGYSAKRRKAKWILTIIAVACLALALPNLQKETNRAGGGFSGLDVMLVLDVSNSMTATDIQPSRLDKAKLFASKLMEQLVGNRIGIVVFARTAYLQLPLTTDINAAKLFLHSISPNLIAEQGTNISSALQVANASMNPAELKYKAAILLTDGEELDGNVSSVIDELKNSGVYLITLGVGTTTGSTIKTSSNEPKFDSDGNVVVSKLNEELLKSITEKARGSYFKLDYIDQSLNAVISEMETLDKKPISNSRLINYESLSYWLIWVAFILLLIEMYLPDNIMSRTKLERLMKKSFRAAVLLGLLGCTIQLQAQQGNKQLDARLSLLKGNEAYRKGKLDEAEKHYADVLATNPNHAIALGNMGNIALKRKQFKEAAENYQKVIEQDASANAAALNNNLGLSHAEDKQLQEAVNNFKSALKENPYDDRIRENLYKALQELQQQQQQQQQNQQQNKNQQQDQQQQQQDQQDQQKEDPNKQEQQQKEQQQQQQQQQKQREADNKLQALQQEEQKIRERMGNKKNSKGASGTEKDW